MADHPSLLLGSMELYDEAGATFGCEVLVEGTSRGRAVPITETIESFLEQGAIEITQGWETREVPIRVEFTSDDILDGLAAAEAALIAELNKPNTLVWTPWHPDLPGDHLGTPVVFDVINSWLEPVEDEGWDTDDTETTVRSVYQIRLVCRSFVHALGATVVQALVGEADPSITNITPASSATGWTATFDGASVTATLVSGAVQVAGTVTDHDHHQAVLKPPSSVYPIDVSTERFLIVDYYLSSQTIMSYVPVANFNGATADYVPVAVFATGNPGQYRAVFDTDEFGAVSSLTDVVLDGTVEWFGGGSGSASIGWRVDSIGKSVAIPSAGGERELLRSFSVKGSAPAPGSLEMKHPSSSLGEVLIYTCPDLGDGYSPAGRPFRVSGGTVTTDAAALSGSSEPMDANPTFDYPAGTLEDGEYLVVVRCKADSTSSDGERTINWTATPRLNDTDLDSVETRSTIITTTTAYELHRLGMIHLPTMTLPPRLTSTLPGAFMRISVDDSAAGTTFDNIYLLNMTTGQVTHLLLGTGAPAVGGPSKCLWIDAPSVNNEGRGDLLRGHEEDRSDAFSAYPAAIETGRHQFDPRYPVKVFSIATNPASAVTVSFTYQAAGLTRVLSTW